MIDPAKIRKGALDPRETLNEVLKNLHGSLKWYWQVVMGLAMVKAVDTLYGLLFVSREGEPLVLLLFTFAFLPTFIRFYFGDSRYLDAHYIEHRKWRPVAEYLVDTQKKISTVRMLLDITLLMVIGIAFVFMALSLSRPDIFYSTYLALLLFDVLWLVGAQRLDKNQRKTPIVVAEQDKNAPRFWVRNNLIRAIPFMMPCLFWYFSYPPVQIDLLRMSVQQVILIALCITNSYFDIQFVKGYYFPKLDYDYGQRLSTP